MLDGILSGWAETKSGGFVLSALLAGETWAFAVGVCFLGFFAYRVLAARRNTYARAGAGGEISNFEHVLRGAAYKKRPQALAPAAGKQARRVTRARAPIQAVAARLYEQTGGPDKKTRPREITDGRLRESFDLRLVYKNAGRIPMEIVGVNVGYFIGAAVPPEPLYMMGVQFPGTYLGAGRTVEILAPNCSGITMHLNPDAVLAVNSREAKFWIFAELRFKNASGKVERTRSCHLWAGRHQDSICRSRVSAFGGANA